MATQATLSDVIERLRAEGQLTRNTGAHSIKSVKVEIGNFLNSQTDVLREMLAIMQAQEARALLSRAGADSGNPPTPTPPGSGDPGNDGDEEANKKKKEAGGILSMIFGPALNAIKDIGGSFLTSFMTPLKSLLKLVRIGGPIAIVLGLMWEVFKDIGENETFINAIQTVKQVWSEKVLPTFERLKNLFTNFINAEGTQNVIEGALAIWNNVRETLQNFVSNTITVLANTVGGILDGINLLIDGDFIGGLNTIVGSLLSGIMGMIDNIMTTILEAFGVDFGEDGTLFGWIGTKVTELWDWVTGIFGSITDTVASMWETVSGGVTSLGSWIWDQISGAWSWIAGVFGNAATFIGESWNALTGGVSSLGSWIWGQVEGVWNWFSGIFSDATTFIGESWAALTGGITSIGSWIWGKVDGVWSWMQGVFSDPAAFIKESWDTVTGGITSIGSWIWGKVEGVWNWIQGMFDDLLGMFPTIEEMKESLLSYLPDWMRGLVEGETVEGAPQQTTMTTPGPETGVDFSNSFRTGTPGFMDFGPGSLAMLHGIEAVVPRNTPAGEFLAQNFDENLKPIMGRIASVETAAINNRPMQPIIVSNAPTVAPVNNNVTGPTNVNNQRVTSIGTGSGSGLARFAN